MFWLLVPVSVISLKAYFDTHKLLVGLVFAVSAMLQITSWLLLFKERRREKYPWTDPKIGSVTKFGMFHTILTIGVGVIAIQTGLNLVYSIFGVLLALIFVSMILSRINFFSLKIERILPDELFAQTPVSASAVIKNNKNRFSVFSIWMEEAWPPDVKRPSILPFAYALRIKAKSSDGSKEYLGKILIIADGMSSKLAPKSGLKGKVKIRAKRKIIQVVAAVLPKLST